MYNFVLNDEAKLTLTTSVQKIELLGTYGYKRQSSLILKESGDAAKEVW